MKLNVDDLSRFIVIGDRVLLKPTSPEEKTASGLYLPPGVEQNERIRTGYVIKCGPGYPIPAAVEDEPWKEPLEKVSYIPLQAREGDLALYLQKQAFELEFNNEKYMIVPQSAILMLLRDDELF